VPCASVARRGLAFFGLFDHGKVSILIGRDDQTWDVGIKIPVRTLNSILREVEVAT